jgi:hypothetical protein
MNLPKVMARALGTCLALALAGFLAIIAIAAFPSQDGVDFYHFWGIDTARKAGSLADSPYHDAPSYARVLNAVADASPSPKLRRANAARRELEPTGTPFLYACFSFLPRDYATAQALFVALLYAAGLAGTFVLARLRGFGPRTSACLASFVAITYVPFTRDVTATNVNLLQLAAYAALLCAALRARGPRYAATEAIAQSGAWILVVFKPNTVLMSAAYVAQRFLAIGQGPSAKAASIAFAAAILAVAAGAWYFGSVFAWTDWWSTAGRLGTREAINAIERGNQSLSMWLAVRFGFQSPVPFGLALGSMLVGAIVIAARGPRGGATDTLRNLRRAFADPFFALSFGVLATFALSPLVWVHYTVLTLIPIAWLSRGEGWLAMSGALFAYCAAARPTIHAFESLGRGDLTDAIGRVAWIALVPGMFVFVRSRRAQGASVPPPVG